MPAKSNIYIGTSGFSYDDWLGNFYPQFCPKADYLRFYTSVFNTVEIDSTYYRIPAPEIIKRWHKQTPDNFRFTAKFPAKVTHEGNLESRLEHCHRFIDAMQNLDGKLGPLIMQFPYSFKPDEKFSMLEKLIASLPGEMKFGVEVRNKKWLTEQFSELLSAHDVSLVQVDHPWMPKISKNRAKFAYIRLLGDRAKIESDFSYVRDERKDDLSWWSNIIEEYSREKGEVYAYVNNHYTGHSPSAARFLIELLQQN